VTSPFPESKPPLDDARGLLTTEALLPRARAGDRDAQRELFVRFTPILERLLHARMPAHARGVHETDDLVQEVVLRALAHLGDFEYRGPGSFWSYLRRIGLNYVAEVVRRSEVGNAPRTANGSTLDGVDPNPGPGSAIVNRESFERFERELSDLNEVHRQAVLMRLELRLPYEDIATQCGFASADAARMAIKRAYERLAQRLSHDESGE
jgi:RNA polymerase sigma factor (sigma-70 family)